MSLSEPLSPSLVKPEEVTLMVLEQFVNNINNSPDVTPVGLAIVRFVIVPLNLAVLYVTTCGLVRFEIGKTGPKILLFAVTLPSELVAVITQYMYSPISELVKV